MQTTNPVLSRKDAFTSAGAGWGPVSAETLETMYATPQRMTLDDVVIRTGALLGLIVATGALAWTLAPVRALALPAAIVGFVLALVVIFKRSTNPALISAYAAVEGVFLGGVSYAYNAQFNGIVLQAVVGTTACFGATLVAYKSGRLRATPRFARMITASLVGIMGIYLVDIVLRLFGSAVPGINDATPFGILISLVIVAVASLSFVLDFDAIEKAVAAGAPDREAWRAAFGLVVGLVWLYLEMLRLLAKLRE